MRELTRWLSESATAADFPYSPVLHRFHSVGKHFVPDDLLVDLDRIRRHLPARTTVEPASARLLRDFLDVALDKWDGRYDYRSYLALPVLRLTGGDTHDHPGDTVGRLTGDTVGQPGHTDGRPGDTDGHSDDAAPGGDPGSARRDRDLLLVRLVADVLAFELAARDGTDLLPEQRPGPAVVTKRCRLGIRAAAPALARLGLAAAVAGQDPTTAARTLPALVAGGGPTAGLALRLSLLPVYVSHDEYLFIRVLQAYECIFAGLATELRAVMAALCTGLARDAAERLAYARDVLTDAGPLFSLLATMQPEAFRTFREYTEGASAIQSHSYKLMESLCRTPERSRLDSAAYRSVPQVRDRVLGGQSSIDGAYRAAVREGLLSGAARELVESRMRTFAAAVLQWRRTHHRLATRMLGERRGTGYTEGTPYLAGVRSIAVFTAVGSGCPAPTIEANGGCPV